MVQSSKFLSPKFQLNTLTSSVIDLALTVLFGKIASFLAFHIDQPEMAASDRR
jgi:hypothetical protein